MAKYLYITGRGHSGSTVLDAMLGNSNYIESVGELISGMNRYDARCSCGLIFSECDFWNQVRSHFEKITDYKWGYAAELLKRQGHILQFPRTLISRLDSRWASNIVEINKAIADSIEFSSGKEITVDSSKEVTRALFLLRFLPDTRIIHLVRDPMQILESNFYRMRNNGSFKFLRKTYKVDKVFFPYLLVSTIGWLAGNLLIEICSLFSRHRVLRVRYEDLIDSPLEQFERLSKFIGFPLGEIQNKIKKNDLFDMGHNIGGNHMRMAGSFIFDPRKSSRFGLHKRYQLVVRFLCYPLMKRYGY